jgi:transaldolase
VKFFLDSANLDEISEVASWGVLSGVTTNPTLYAREGGKLSDFNNHIKQICLLVDGPVSAEATAKTRRELITQGRELAALAPNVVVKIPTTIEGLAATRTLASDGIFVNMTLCFSVPQALLAARSGARYISPFVGRFDDISENGIEHLENIINAISGYDFTNYGPDDEDEDENEIEIDEVEIIAASIRSANHVTQAALAGADIATIPFGILKKCIEHPLTTNGLAAFDKDWEKVKNA